MQGVEEVQAVGPSEVVQQHSTTAGIVEHTVVDKRGHTLVQEQAWVQVVEAVDL